MSIATIPDTPSAVSPIHQCLARALYDNIADSPDELAFRRGDVLTVLEQNTGGCEGWWLCSLRGRQGICPGNRLRIIPGAFDTTAAHRPRRSRAASASNITCSPTPIYSKLDESELYDVPGPPQPIHRAPEEFTYDFPRPSTTSDWYDAPRAPRPASADSGTGSAGSYDIPKSRALPLTCDAALDALDRLQEDAQAAVARLLSHVKPNWRRRGALTPHITDLRVAATRLRTSLHDLVVFADATLMNAMEAQDKGLAPKLRPVIKALRDAERISHEATSALDAGDWAVNRLERDEEPTGGGCDALDQLVVCARGLTEDVRRITSLVHGNAKLLFKGSLSSEWTEYCDYVRLESREVVDRQRAEIRATLPHKLKGPLDSLSRELDTMRKSNLSASEFSARLPPDDRALASFYASHTATHETYLKDAVDTFLRTIGLSESPQSFLAQGKFVVLGAHRLIRVGDAVHRAAKDSLFAIESLRKTDALAEALASTIAACRASAERWPCAAAVAEMRRCARALLGRAHELRKLLLCASDEHNTPVSTVVCPS